MAFSSCSGCSENQPNQLAHMNFGGCLYYDAEGNDWITDMGMPDAAVAQSPVRENFPSEEVVGCVVCLAQDYFQDNRGGIRRASHGTIRCRDHTAQCAYCRSPECSDTFLLCERCSYSGAGSVTQAILGSSTKVCSYDTLDITPSDGWACGCQRCIQTTTSFYVLRALEEGFAQSPASPLDSPRSGPDRGFKLEKIIVD